MTIEELQNAVLELTGIVKEMESDLATAQSDLRVQGKQIERLQNSLREAHNEISHLGQRSYNP